MRLVLYVNGGRFELADKYTADSLGMYLRSPTAAAVESAMPTTS